MNSKKWVLAGLCCLAITTIFSQDSTKVELLKEVVITDSRFKLNRENSGKTIIKITSDDLKQLQGQTLTQIINGQTGITINGSLSNAGQNLNTFVRGGQNRQVLVLIDGIAVNDASQIENNFDLQLLDVSQIESMEILKGASSALYGNRASTAVINITTKKTKNKPIAAAFSSSIGTNNTQNKTRMDIRDFNNAASVYGQLDKFNYRVNFSNRFANGMSAVSSDNSNVANESDRFSRTNVSANVGYELVKKWKVNAGIALDDYETSFDDGFFFADANNVSHNKMVRATINSEYQYKNGSITTNAAFSDTEREFESSFPSKFDAKTYVVDIFNKYAFSDNFLTVIGLNYLKNEMNSFEIPFGSSDFAASIVSEVANDEIIDPYLNLTYITEFGLNINAGARLNNHSSYGSHFVYNVNPSYRFKLNDNLLKVFSSVSTAFVTPSLFQLFAPGFGNDQLQPQEDRTIEGGASLESKNISLTALYFTRSQKEQIDFVIVDQTTFQGEYQNVPDEVTITGVEVELKTQPLKNTSFNANYTFTESLDRLLVRIPKHRINGQLGYQFSNKLQATAQYQWQSERISPFLNEDFTANRILESFGLLNLNTSYELIPEKMTIFVSVINLFNEDYEELFRFNTLGRNIQLGFRLNF